MKRTPGWKITTIMVTVKHRPYYGRGYLAADIRAAISPRDRDDIKAVRTKCVATPKTTKQ